jgi:hypothetical protein
MTTIGTQAIFRRFSFVSFEFQTLGIVSACPGAPCGLPVHVLIAARICHVSGGSIFAKSGSGS